MATVHELRSIQWIPVKLEQAWEFFSDTHNLLTITPPSLNLKLNNNLFGKEAYAGQVITYKVKPLLGIPVFWMTEITHLEPMKMFVDEQRKGPYSIWHHQHHFKSVEGGVEMTDLIHYSLPFGFAGNLANGLVKRKLTDIFSFRYHKIVELFGSWPGKSMRLTIH